jgi:hypothetical protein
MIAKSLKYKSLKDASLWLDRSLRQNKDNGSSAYFHLIKGWSGPYPETTGYLIPTLYNLSNLEGYEKYGLLAQQQCDWLLSIQNTDGSFPQGLALGTRPEIFDGGQILFGILATYKVTKDAKYYSASIALIDWMVRQQDENGAFTASTYVNSYSPSYHVRFVWALALGLEIYKDQSLLKNVIQKALEYYSGLIQENGAFRNWGFHPHDAGLTHTIAYTIRGFIECGIILKQHDLISLILPTIKKLEEDLSHNKYLAGEYDTEWKGNYSFRCLTGEAQMSIIYRRLYDIYGEVKYEKISNKLLEQVYAKQVNAPVFSNIHGGFFASSPFYGKYMRLMMNNWTCKFYLDALMQSLNIDTKLLG